jgi:quercetin dioxygenase-like cupin family protein
MNHLERIEDMRMKTLIIAAAAPFALASMAAAQTESAVHDPGPDHHLVYLPEDVEWRDGPASFEPGAQFAVLEGDPAQPGVFTMRIRMPDGFRIAPHWHPNPERVTVVSGTFRLGSGEVLDPAATTPLGPGSYTSMPPGMRHYAIADGETVIQLTSTGPWLITYVRSEDDPRGRE